MEQDKKHLSDGKASVFDALVPVLRCQHGNHDRRTVEGIENLVPLSDFRHSDFDENYGVLMADGPLQGLLARSVVVIDREGKVVYTELVPEITQEPDYDRAVEAAKRA